MDFIESSAKSNMNVKESFLKLVKDICELKAQQAPPVLPIYENSSLSLARDTQPIAKEVSGGCGC